ncbi:MAG TPA: phosphatidylglycerophosphatase A [Paracoccaceae bacterium]|nr:phosphatidylglycerophosphatase A [Paracoccaceae bacterium]
MNAARLIATGFGTGLLPAAPGTWASLAALPAAAALHWAGSFPALLAATALAFAAGLWATAQEIAARSGEDPPEIVIDEIVGQWIALFPLSAGLWLRDMPTDIFPWPGWVAGFLLFRFFDILKPPPVRWADRLKNPLGVMLDDVLAGIMAGALLMVAAAVAHGWFA